MYYICMYMCAQISTMYIHEDMYLYVPLSLGIRSMPSIYTINYPNTVPEEVLLLEVAETLAGLVFNCMHT